MVSAQNAIASFTQDSTNAAWAQPPGQVSIAAPPLGGGNVINAGTGTLKYAPILGTSTPWCAIIIGIKPNITTATLAVTEADDTLSSAAFAVQPSATLSVLEANDTLSSAAAITGFHVVTVPPTTRINGIGYDNRGSPIYWFIDIATGLGPIDSDGKPLNPF
jgi:hypothetical protein